MTVFILLNVSCSASKFLSYISLPFRSSQTVHISLNFWHEYLPFTLLSSSDEGQRAQQPKRCYSNKYEDNSPHINSVSNSSYINSVFLLLPSRLACNEKFVWYLPGFRSDSITLAEKQRLVFIIQMIQLRNWLI